MDALLWSVVLIKNLNFVFGSLKHSLLIFTGDLTLLYSDILLR